MRNIALSQHIHPLKSQDGNAMIYVLIALALFGFLTVTMSRQNQQADGRNLSKESIALYANELIEYNAAAQQAIDMMLASGAEISDLDFVEPSDTDFNTPPHIYKVFHPQGGGLNYVESPSSEMMSIIGGTGGWEFQNQINVEWTSSPANDIILTAHQIDRSVCEKINEKITGSNNIPALTENLGNIFLTTGSNLNLNTTRCPGCEGISTLCVSNSAVTAFGYYNILAAQ